MPDASSDWQAFHTKKGRGGGGMSNIHFVETGKGSSQEGHFSDSTTLCGRVPKFQAAGTGSAFMKYHWAMLDWLVNSLKDFCF